FFQAEDGIRARNVTGVQTCALPIFGQESVDSFGTRLPFLLKVLSARKALSIQVHPNREQARLGFASEEAAGITLDAPDRNYKDRSEERRVGKEFKEQWSRHQ